MSPQEQYRLQAEGERDPRVVARRRARARVDLLAERARCVALWNADSWQHHCPPVWVFYQQPGYRRFLMPGVRAHLNARLAARKQRYAAELRESVERSMRAKLLRHAAPMPLFEGVGHA